MRIAVEEVIPKKYIPELEDVCKSTKNKDIYLRAKALLLRAEGKTLNQIKETLGLPPATVKFYTARLKKEGIGGLSYHGQPGNHHLLTSEQWLELKAYLVSLEGWTKDMVEALLAQKLGIQYADPQSYAELMEKAGYVYVPVWECYVTCEKHEESKDLINEMEVEFRKWEIQDKWHNDRLAKVGLKF